MTALHCQPAIAPGRTLGESPFRFQLAGTKLEALRPATLQSPRSPFVPDADLARIRADDLWLNRHPASVPTRRKLPTVAATGRVITRQEIDDAMDD